jgi:hypothetical protein
MILAHLDEVRSVSRLRTERGLGCNAEGKSGLIDISSYQETSPGYNLSESGESAI